MVWARVDDAWWSHPKVIDLDLAARGLWISALAWSCQHRTDRVPRRVLFVCGGDEEVAARLVSAGLWSGPHDDGSYTIHDWDDYQSERAKKADAGRQGGQRSGEVRRSQTPQPNEPSDPDEANGAASHEARGAASHEAGPSRPVPSLPDPGGKGRAADVEDEGGAGGSRRKRRTPSKPLPDDWKPTDSHREKAASLGVDANAEAEAFRDHHLARDSRFADWDRAFHTWLTNTQKFGANGRANGRPPPGGYGSKGADYAARYEAAAAQARSEGR